MKRNCYKLKRVIVVLKASGEVTSREISSQAGVTVHEAGSLTGMICKIGYATKSYSDKERRFVWKSNENLNTSATDKIINLIIGGLNEE